jgi:LPS O-antigen subunit length determinant protein (WzzB/FepE family)
MNEDNSGRYYDEKIDLKQLFKSFKEGSRFIFGFTGIVTLITIVYLLFFSPPSQYNVEASFLEPTEISIIRLNQYSEKAFLAETVYTKFLTTLNSSVFQRGVFDDDGYLKRLQKEGESIVDVDKYIANFIRTISLSKEKDPKDVGLPLPKMPHILATKNSNPDVVSEFLDAIITKADKDTINYFIDAHKLKTVNRLTELTEKRSELLDDAHQSRLNQIVTFKDAAAIASSLDIIESNLGQLNKGSINMDLAKKEVTIPKIYSFNQESFDINNPTLNLPNWYLFGETSLLKMIESLETRASDEAFIPQLIELDSEILKLKSFRLDSAGINAMQLYKAASGEILPSKNRSITVLAFISSFILSILLVFLMNAFKEEDVTIIQKGK